MKRVLYFSVVAIFFASCGSNNQSTNATDQARLDSMSQALTRQHVIDSMSAANTANSSHAAVTPVRERRNHESYAHERSQSYSGSAPVNNNVSPTPVNVAPAAPVVMQPSAADIAAQKKAAHRAELKSAAEGALIGAGAGALGGAVAGKNKKYKEQDAAIGGGVGAALGAGAGLLLEKRKLKRDSAQH